MSHTTRHLLLTATLLAGLTACGSDDPAGGTGTGAVGGGAAAGASGASGAGGVGAGGWSGSGGSTATGGAAGSSGAAGGGGDAGSGLGGAGTGGGAGSAGTGGAGTGGTGTGGTGGAGTGGSGTGGTGTGGTGGAPYQCVAGFDTSLPGSGPTPALNQPFTDPNYATTVRRVTDPSQITDTNTNVSWVRHEYSRRPAFNVDSTRVLQWSSNGWWRLYSLDAQGSMAFVKSLNAGSTIEPNWHPTNPNRFYMFHPDGKGLTIREYDVVSNAITTKVDLGTRIKALFPTAAHMWTRGEGRPSQDGRYWCMQIETQASGMLGIVTYDMQTDQILGSLATTDRPDHVSMSPLGNYCVPSWTSSKGTRAYSRNLQTFVQLHTQSEHSDLGVTKDGKEVYIYADYSAGPHGGNVTMVDMATGTGTKLFPLYGSGSSSTAIHLSATSFNRPGYVVASTYYCRQGGQNCNASSQWFKDKVFVVELKASPKLCNLAHTRGTDAGYFSSPQAVANRDLTRVLFASTWGGQSESAVRDYLIQLPSNAFP
ncbi:MAG: hypothetical protein KF718_12560 [Polyangiaceae bacterium]|nr:hypothetical protein [Polyangiaceae bacterium]